MSKPFSELRNKMSQERQDKNKKQAEEIFKCITCGHVIGDDLDPDCPVVCPKCGTACCPICGGMMGGGDYTYGECLEDWCDFSCCGECE